MDLEVVPPALRERLGPEATLGLLVLFEGARRDWVNDVIAICAERFERRLVEETASLRVAIAEGDAALRVAIAEGIVRSESALRQEISTLEKTLLKWSFLFWIGQVVAVAGIVGVMLQVAGRP